jgi:hypothetical protein
LADLSLGEVVLEVQAQHVALARGDCAQQLGERALAVRPRLVRRGATDEELRRAYPGADLSPGGTRSATMACTIDARPSRVWPWLVQMGTDRAGWYSWDRPDNFGRRSADRVHPEWQQIAVGDRLAAKPDGSEWWEVAALEPERFLGLRMSLDLRGRPFDPAGTRPRRYTDSTWGFLLEELPGARTRLVVSGYWSLRPRCLQRVLSVVFLEPSHWIMPTRQFANLKRRAERDESRAARAGVRGRGWRAANAIVGALARAGSDRFTCSPRAAAGPAGPTRPPWSWWSRRAGAGWSPPTGPWLGSTTRARPAGVSVRRGRDTGDCAVRELPADEAGPVPQRYVAIASKTRAHFQASNDAPVADVAAEAHHHPVFELTSRR